MKPNPFSVFVKRFLMFSLLTILLGSTICGMVYGEVSHYPKTSLFGAWCILFGGMLSLCILFFKWLNATIVVAQYFYAAFSLSAFMWALGFLHETEMLLSGTLLAIVPCIVVGLWLEAVYRSSHRTLV